MKAALLEKMAADARLGHFLCSPSDVLRLLEERAALLDAAKKAGPLVWHPSHCAAYPPGAGDQPCTCGYDEADDAISDALRKAAAP